MSKVRKKGKASKASRRESHQTASPAVLANGSWAPMPAYAVDLDVGRLRNYAPELADWLPPEHVRGDDPDRLPAGINYRVYEAMPGAVRARGRLIATIVMGRAFHVGGAKPAARLMSFAPALWRVLRDVAPFALAAGTPEAIAAFHQAEALLWDSAGRRPYECPRNHEDDAVRLELMKRESGGQCLPCWADRTVRNG